MVKYGYMDKTGTIIITPQFEHDAMDMGSYTYASDPPLFHSGLAWVAVKTENNLTKYGFINLQGELAIPAVYDMAHSFVDDTAWVCYEGKWGVIDRAGGWVTEPRYYGLYYDFPDERGWYITYEEAAQFPYGAYINHRGELMTGYDFQVSGSSIFHDDRAFVHLEEAGKETHYCIDRTGRAVFEYDSGKSNIHNYSEGLAPVFYNGAKGYLDPNGNLAFTVDADEISGFSEGLAPIGYKAAEEGGKRRYGFIDTSGQIVLEPIYTRVISSFHGGVAYVATEEKVGLIDTAGNWQLVLPPDLYLVSSYEDTDGVLFSEGLYLVYT